jgi:hypothetical protein
MLTEESGFANFLAELFRSSRVEVASLAEFTPEEREHAARCLTELEQRYRDELHAITETPLKVRSTPIK